MLALLVSCSAWAPWCCRPVLLCTALSGHLLSQSSALPTAPVPVLGHLKLVQLCRLGGWDPELVEFISYRLEFASHPHFPICKIKSVFSCLFKIFKVLVLNPPPLQPPLWVSPEHMEKREIIPQGQNPAEWGCKFPMKPIQIHTTLHETRFGPQVEFLHLNIFIFCPHIYVSLAQLWL